jgi:hypothetical protein
MALCFLATALGGDEEVVGEEKKGRAQEKEVRGQKAKALRREE